MRSATSENEKRHQWRRQRKGRVLVKENLLLRGKLAGISLWRVPINRGGSVRKGGRNLSKCDCKSDP